jgi:hypothetical protein
MGKQYFYKDPSASPLVDVPPAAPLTMAGLPGELEPLEVDVDDKSDAASVDAKL